MRRTLASAARCSGVSVGVGGRLRSTLVPPTASAAVATTTTDNLLTPSRTHSSQTDRDRTDSTTRTTRTNTTSRTNARQPQSQSPRPKPAAFVRRLRAPQELASPTHKPRARLRVADKRVGALLAGRTEPPAFVAFCEELRQANEVELLAGTDLSAWNVALQNRLRQDDARGARALLDLLLGFDAENASEQLWSDVLFTLLRQRAHFSDERDVLALLATLRRKCGDDFVARVVVSLVNGCANIKMFDEARFLVRFFHRSLRATTVELPPRVLGNLISTMQTKRRFQGVIALADELFAGVPLTHVQPQVWIALFRSCEQTRTTDLARHVDRVIAWFHALQDAPADEQPQFERVLGAAVQSCVSSGNERLALRVFHAMTERDEASDDSRDEEAERAPRRVRPDENIYVNVLKATRAVHDDALFRDVYYRMARDGVARSAGFGSAIRFCHATHDVPFLEEVLDDAFTVEDTLARRSRASGWFLPLEQYNDALGCLAETKSFDRAKDLFARLLENPRVTPDHITMVEMVENYREAPFSDVFELMEVFLELQLTPNMHVFTSLLATCGRHRLINDAMALVAAMQRQGVVPDLKASTALGFVYGAHGHLVGIVEMLQTMEAQGIATDNKFFDVVLDGVYEANGIDMCFELFRETLAAGLRIPAGMYAALLRIGTKVGLVERTLHIAYNMECDGIPMTSAQLLALLHRCEGSAEVTELARTFLLLHQGRQAMGTDDDDARFSRDVYEEMAELLVAFSQRDAAAKVKQLAEAAGYELW